METTKKEINPNKKALLERTAIARSYQKELKRKAEEKGLMDFQIPNINAIITDGYRKEIAEQFKVSPSTIEFKTFKQWKDEGKFVKKGEKGFPVWTRPMKKTEKMSFEETATGNTIEGEYAFEFWGMAYVFSNLQVA